MRILSTTLYAASIAAAISAFAMPAMAEWKPKGPIKLMIAFRAGGGVDTQARLIAEAISKGKGWKIIPQQVTGKAGAVLARKLKGEPKDGLTIAMLVTEAFGYNMLVMKKPAYGINDFTYLTTTSGSQMGIVAKKDKGWKSFKDVIAAAKKGKTFKAGAMSQKLADGMYLLGKVHGVKFNTVKFRGGKGVMNAITAGDIDFGWVAGLQARAVKAGDVVNLASGETSKLKVSPNAPLVKDLGVPFDFGANFIFVAPAGIPADARKTITDAIVEVVKDPKTKANKFISRAFGGPKIIRGKALDEYIKNGIKASQALLKASG